MKQVMAYEFKDLSKGTKLKTWEKEIDSIVDMEVNQLTEDLHVGSITKEEYYSTLGCSKYYAETTPWFVPSCYYDKHAKDVKTWVKDNLKELLFDKAGEVIYL